MGEFGIEKQSWMAELMLVRDYLDRAFQRKLSEQSDSHVVMSNRAIDEGEDVNLAAYNKANRKSIQEMSELEDTMNTKKRRPGRISSQMKSVRDGNKVSPQDSAGPGGSLDIYNTLDIAEDGVSHSTISEIARAFQPKKYSGHVTRSRILKYLGTDDAYPPVTDQTRIPKISHVHEHGESWRRPLVYPKDGKKKSTVEQTDLDRLGEGEYFNDTLISFYLRYLEHKLEERNAETAKRVYLFNSFFYASLTKPQKGKKGINYEAVQKWTRGVDIFNYDYVVVPINESLHWYFAVICNLPALHRNFSRLEEDTFSSPPPHTSPPPRQHQECEPSGLPPDTANFHADVSVTQSMRPTQITTSTEEDARSSFADLSLDQGDELIDRDMLNAQSTCTRVEALASSEQAPHVQAIIEERITVGGASAEPESPIAVSSKKRKRRSLPTGKRLDPTEPAIVTFDSLAVAHAPTVRTLKDYLKAEAHSKRNMVFDDSQLKGMTAVGIPKQDNYCDCGPYLLGYMDKLLEDPKGFMEKTMRKQLDAEKDWPQLDPSNLRSSIRDLIISLHNQQENERKASGRKDSRVKPPQKQEAKSSPDHVLIEEQDITTTLSPTPAAQAESTFSKIYQTRTEALQHALKVDEVEKAAVTVPPQVSQTRTERETPSLDEKQSVNLIDINPVQSQPAIQRSNMVPSEVHIPEDSPITLPSTIQDSQPQESFQFLEELQPDSTGTLSRQLDLLSSDSIDASPAKQGTVDPPRGPGLMHPTQPTPKIQSKHHFFVQID